MKKINLLQEIIIVSRKDFFQAINSNNKFAINIDGTIVYEPFPNNLISIFEGKIAPVSPLNTSLDRSFSSFLGNEYKIVEDDDRILIKASGAWQNIIKWNQIRSEYDDTSADGIAEFSHSELEEIGWYATDFDITYRSIVDQLEKLCDGILLCIERDNPYQFSGMGFITDILLSKKIAYDFVKENIKVKLLEDTQYQSLTNDEKKALDFFNLS